MSDQEKYNRIFEANNKWIEKNKIDNPGLFKLLAADQHPDFLYIGCSDSRVHPNQVMGLKPGEVFIHRNIANMVIATDLSALSVINYGVEYLKVKFIIVCGHYGCGGIEAAMKKSDYGILNPWLRSIRDVYHLHKEELAAIDDIGARHRRLVELNTYEQCRNIIKMGFSSIWTANLIRLKRFMILQAILKIEEFHCIYNIITPFFLFRYPA